MPAIKIRPVLPDFTLADKDGVAVLTYQPHPRWQAVEICDPDKKRPPLWCIYKGRKRIADRKSMIAAMEFISEQNPPVMTKDEAEQLLYDAMTNYEISYDGGILNHYKDGRWSYFGATEEEAVRTLMNGRHKRLIPAIKKGIRVQQRTEWGE